MVIEPTTSGAVSIVPTVNGVTLVELVGGYEAAHGYSPAGGYAGIVPGHFRFGDLVSYYVGDDNGEWPRTGVIWLLGCDCGEVGCWPLEARVRAHEGRVEWSHFRQPHRPAWDYTDFGPFTFDAPQYLTAVRSAAAAWRSAASG